MPTAKILRLVPAIHRATHAISVYLERGAQLGITQAEAHILTHLWTFGESTVAQLHAAFGHRRSTLTSILDRLAARNFIVRESSETDRRTFVIRLTQKGGKKAKNAFKYLEAFEREVFTKVKHSDLSGFSSVIEAVSNHSKSKV